MSMKIGVQVYSVRGDASADLKGTLKRIKEMGYDGVELAGLYSYTPTEIRAMCDEIGLVPISAHVPYPELLADPAGVLAKYKEIGCEYVAFPWLAPEDRPESGNFGRTIEGIGRISEVAKEMGITTLYHNHDFEFVKLDGKYALDVLYEKVGPELLATEIDTCWVNVGGEDPANYVRKYAGRAPIVHLKDFYGEKSDNMYGLIGVKDDKPKRPSNFEFRPVGYGVQDMPEIIKAAGEAGAEWLIVEQDQPSMGLTPMECIAKSREYLKTVYA